MEQENLIPFKKTKILHLPVASNHKGGVTQYVRDRMHWIDSEKFQFDYLTFGTVLDFQEEIACHGGNVYYISARAEESREAFIQEISAVLENGYDVVHLHTLFWKGFLLEELAIKYNVPKIIVHSHSSQIDVIDEEKRAEALALHEKQKQVFSPQLATHFCACSEAAADWLFGSQIPKEEIQLLYNAIDITKFQFSPTKRKKIRKECGLEGKTIWGHVGRFAYQKNHHFLLEVLRQFPKKEEVCLLLVGVGPLEQEIKTLVEDYGLTENVRFLGAREDVPRILQGLDLFLLPSRFEGLPIVLVEAQCAGLPCFVMDTVTKESKLTDLVHFLPEDAQVWTEEIEKAKFGTRGDYEKIVASKGYEIKEQVKKLELLYQREPLKT